MRPYEVSFLPDEEEEDAVRLTLICRLETSPKSGLVYKGSLSQTLRDNFHPESWLSIDWNIRGGDQKIYFLLS